MRNIHIKFAPDVLKRAALIDEHDLPAIKFILHRYVSVPVTWEISDKFTGKQLAEELFDLTNNPARETEREEKYGIGPSISPGDIVEIDSVNYVCLSFGWAVLGDNNGN
jgi:hypothetical protein